MARPPGMFSTSGMTPTTAAPGFRAAIAFMAPSTAAPPDMSLFIRCIFSDGLIEMPPVSKVTPLPTRPSTARVTGRTGS